MKMKPKAEKPKDDGVSITTGFILNMGIAFIAISVMLLTMQGPMERITESTKETQIRVTGEAIVSDFESTDRLVRSLDDPDDIEVEIEQPNVEYSVRSRNNNLYMMTDTLNVTVEYGGETDLGDFEFSSSRDASITYDQSADELVVE